MPTPLPALLTGLALLLGGAGAPHPGLPTTSPTAPMTETLNTQLLTAAQHGQTDRVTELLNAGASPDAADATGRTALTWAAMVSLLSAP